MARDMAEAEAPQATPPGLSYASDLDPGLRRRKAGSGFTYVDPDDRPITDVATLERIHALAIPPAWKKVWICPSPRGHIQATGRDARGRKQYLYHPRWRETRDADKFDRLIAFGRALPKLRARIERDLALPALPRDKVLAAVVRVMEITLIRVGNEEYAKANKSFGVTTLRDRHVRIAGGRAVFEFLGKSGKVHKTGFRDRRLAQVVKACQDVPGQRLFQYVDEDGARHAIESADVNAYLRDAMGEDFSAKDFRTWAGTVATARALAESPQCETTTQSKRHIDACVKAVAGVLGNTAAVARTAYIHPALIQAYMAGVLPLRRPTDARAFELQVLRFLEGARYEAQRAAKLAKRA